MDQSIDLTLTDFSENMVSIAKNALGEQNHISYGVVNIENIPYTDNCFDRVIANMMLYHVSNLDKGLSEVKRILTQDYEDSLAITDIDDVLNYIYSLTNMSSIAELERQSLKEVLEKEMVNGVLNIPKEYGMFICTK